MIRCSPARFTPLAFALLTAAGLLATAIAAQRAPTLPQSASAPMDVRAQAVGTAAQSRAEGDLAMDSAVAAAVIGAVAGQFGERRVEVKLDSVAVQPASMFDRDVSGEGRLKIGDGQDDADWIEFQFKALYDTQTASVSHPTLVIGDVGGSVQPIALDSQVARTLGVKAGAALTEEFAGQSVQLVIDRVTTAAAGPRYLRVEALGTADFAAEGTTAAHVYALYDRKTQQWLRVTYELGTTSNWSDQGEAAVAAR